MYEVKGVERHRKVRRAISALVKIFRIKIPIQPLCCVGCAAQKRIRRAPFGRGYWIVY